MIELESRSPDRSAFIRPLAILPLFWRKPNLNIPVFRPLSKMASKLVSLDVIILVLILLSSHLFLVISGILNVARSLYSRPKRHSAQNVYLQRQGGRIGQLHRLCLWSHC